MKSKCAIHFQQNLSKSVRAKEKSTICKDLKMFFQSDPTDSVSDGLRKFSDFCNKWKKTPLAVKQTPKRVFSNSFRLSKLQLQHSYP